MMLVYSGPLTSNILREHVRQLAWSEGRAVDLVVPGQPMEQQPQPQQQQQQQPQTLDFASMPPWLSYRLMQNNNELLRRCTNTQGQLDAHKVHQLSLLIKAAEAARLNQEVQLRLYRDPPRFLHCLRQDGTLDVALMEQAFASQDAAAGVYRPPPTALPAAMGVGARPPVQSQMPAYIPPPSHAMPPAPSSSSSSSPAPSGGIYYTPRDGARDNRGGARDRRPGQPTDRRTGRTPTVVCRFFLENACNRGTNCTFIHPDPSAQAPAAAREGRRDDPRHRSPPRRR